MVLKFDYFPFKTVKLIGLSSFPIAFLASNVTSKCGINAEQEIAGMFFVTAILNMTEDQICNE